MPRVLVLGAALFAVLPGSAPGDSVSVSPSASLTPDEVVRCQMEALRNNDAQDRGIAAAFRFASPANRRVTGPLQRFIGMIKNSPYRVMLDYRVVEYGPLQVRADQAEQEVLLLSTDYRAVGFRFYLSRQTHAECDGCWMTDAVTVERVGELPGVQT